MAVLFGSDMIGVHLTVDGLFQPPLDGKILKKILTDLPGRIDMNILSGPHVVQGCPENPGWTGFVIIDKSHISIHTFDDGNKISVDVFSCQHFEKETALSYLKNNINFTKTNTRYFERTED